jgi:hypothetical protein
MPWYHLHIRCDGELIEDDEGAEFRNVASAKVEAVRSVRSLVCGDVRDGNLHLDLSIEIRDEGGAELETVSFDDAITTIPSFRKGPVR